MDWTAGAPIVVAIIGVGGTALVAWLMKDRTRARITADAELLANDSLPPDVRLLLASNVHFQTVKLVQNETDVSRQMARAMCAGGAVILFAFVGLTPIPAVSRYLSEIGMDWPIFLTGAVWASLGLGCLGWLEATRRERRQNLSDLRERIYASVAETIRSEPSTDSLAGCATPPATARVGNTDDISEGRDRCAP